MDEGTADERPGSYYGPLRPATARYGPLRPEERLEKNGEGR
jgi:hypothetical protein